MECSQNQWTNESQFFTQLNQKVIQQHIPIYGSIDLTHRCNLKCVHCYVGPLSNDQNLKKEELLEKE